MCDKKIGVVYYVAERGFLGRCRVYSGELVFCLGVKEDVADDLVYGVLMSALLDCRRQAEKMGIEKLRLPHSKDKVVRELVRKAFADSAIEIG